MKEVMFRLFRYALRDDVSKDSLTLERDVWKKIYNSSKKHDLAHLVGCGIQASHSVIDEDIAKSFEQSVQMAAFRYLKINHDLELLSRALERAEIRFMPLKGSVIRKHYREPWLRTSCDIDVLVSPDDLDRAKDVFVSELGYRYESAWNYEVSFFTPSKTHIELHHVLSDDVIAVNTVLSEVWEHSAPSDGHEFLYEMSDAMYYFYHIAHMAKHFVNGGCGIRPFIDIWVLNHGFEFDVEKREALLEKGGLLQFAKSVEMLSEVWIGDEVHNDVTAEMEQFVMSGGTYGTMENRVAVKQAIKGGKISYLLSRIFLPYDQLKLTFPALEKRRWLMPFYQVKRWFRLLSKKKIKETIHEVKATTDTSADANRRVSDLILALGLKNT